MVVSLGEIRCVRLTVIAAWKAALKDNMGGACETDLVFEITERLSSAW